MDGSWMEHLVYYYVWRYIKIVFQSVIQVGTDGVIKDLKIAFIALRDLSPHLRHAFACAK